uniref:Outer mitochondrial membrane lipid metabolism regulator OPA3 n=1 Tax=Eptatretus burgeri TaxID=7764 RepID=A0A8C4QC20_EPTBU
MVAFPLIKLIILGIRQVSKPMANRISSRARTNHFWRRFCIPPAQCDYHWVDIKFKMHLLGFSVRHVQPLQEDEAAELGSRILSEFFVFLVAGGCLYVEYVRQSESSHKKLQEEQQRFSDLQDRLSHLQGILEESQKDIQQLREVHICEHHAQKANPQTSEERKSSQSQPTPHKIPA